MPANARQRNTGAIETTVNCSMFAFAPSAGCGRLATLAVTFFCCTALMSGQNKISTIVGGKTMTPYSVPALGPYADIPGPSSVVTDKAGNVYVASPDANQIFKVSGGNITVFAGQGWPVERPPLVNNGIQARTAYLNGPYGLSIDGSGNIYIADTGAYIIWQVNPGGIMTQIAGVGDAGGGGDCGPALKAHLSSPYAVANDSAGNLYIADTADNRVRFVNMQSTSIPAPQCPNLNKLLPPGYIMAFAGNQLNPCQVSTDACGDGGPAIGSQLNSPQGVFVDSLGDVLISDTGDHRVRIVKPNGDIYAFAGTGQPCSGGGCVGDGGLATVAGLGAPWQLFVDSNQNVYIADSLQQRIRVVSGGNINTFAGNGVSCSGVNTPPAVQTFCGDAGLATGTNANLNKPEGVYGDTFGNVYIGDTGDQRIRQVQITANGNNLNSYAGGGLSDGPAILAILASNQDIAVDGSGNLYIADSGNNRIRKVSGGVVSTLAGSGLDNYYDNDNVPAVNANLSQPRGLALDSQGNVYIADTFNYVIRVLNTQSSTITIAGVPIAAGKIATVAGKPGNSCPPNTTCFSKLQAARTALLGLPKGIALDGAGDIYIADEAADVVAEVDTQGNISVVAGQFWSKCPSPTDFLACGDTGPATSAELLEPYSVAVDSTGNIFISDAGDNRIREVIGGVINAYAFNGMPQFGPDGQPGLDNSYIFPEYIAIDSRDNMFVSGSSLYYVVQRIDASNNPALLNPVSSIAGDIAVSPKYFGYCCDGGPGIGAFLNNAGIAVDGSEKLYISDGGNNRVRLISSSPTQGLVPVAVVQPASLNFGSVPIGQKSTMSFMLGNTGDDDLLVGTPTISGPFSFVSQTPCYGNVVPPDTGCTFMVTFTPTQAGVQNGQATMNDNGFGSPSQIVQLSGTGTN
jgi:sugar lactone lactonase YvrE